MSTKFNRNDVNTADDKFYINDYKADLNAVEQDNFEDTKDFEDIPCIVSGLTLTPVAYPSVNVTVAAGTARDEDGKRINVPVEQIVQITDTVGGNNYIILSHKYSEDTLRKAYETGTEYDTRKYDDFELTVASSYSADDIVLGNVKVVGAQNLLYLEERTHPVYKPQSGDTTAPTDPSNLVLTSGIMGDDDIPIYDGTKYVKRTERLAWLKADWDPSADYGSGLAGYEIFLIPLNAADVEQIDKRETRKVRYSTSDPRSDITFQNLTTGIKYRIKIRAVDNAGNLSSFIEDDIIAGGAKQIPESCADVLDGDPTITAEDDGIRISWAVLLAYQEKVVGFEFCWTDDETTPDFGNKNHRQVFTKQNSIVLPAKLSSEDDTVVVKMKMRAVDRTYQHCTTPKTLTDTNAKKYPADIAAIVTDRKSILTPGNFPTLKAFLEKSVTLSDGMPKGITMVESYMAELCGTYSTPGERLAAIMGAGVDWKYIRIVAKENTGHFSDIQAAVNSIATPDPHLIYCMPGNYIEDVDIKDKYVGIIGIGASLAYGKEICMINGRIYSSESSSRLLLLENLVLYKDTTIANPYIDLVQNDDCYFNNIIVKGYSSVAGMRVTGNCKMFLDKVRILNGAEKAFIIRRGAGSSSIKLLITNSTFKDTGNFDIVFIETGGETGSVSACFQDCRFINQNGSYYSINGDSDTPASKKIVMLNSALEVCLAPNGTNLTVIYGTAENISNVRFTAEQLPGVI